MCQRFVRLPLILVRCLFFSFFFGGYRLPAAYGAFVNPTPDPPDLILISSPAVLLAPATAIPLQLYSGKTRLAQNVEVRGEKAPSDVIRAHLDELSLAAAAAQRVRRMEVCVCARERPAGLQISVRNIYSIWYIYKK